MSLDNKMSQFISGPNDDEYRTCRVLPFVFDGGWKVVLAMAVSSVDESRPSGQWEDFKRVCTIFTLT